MFWKTVYAQDVCSHHHGDDREEIPVALDSGEAKRKHISEEYHGRSEANSAQNLREGRREVRIISKYF